MAKKKGKSKKARRAPKRSAPKKAKRPARKAKRKAASASASAKPVTGSITHTELASANPDATKAWCARVLGWTFTTTMPTPEGPYHLFTNDKRAGGGIRVTNPGEIAGTVPYVNVPDVKTAYEKALLAGAETMLAPERVTPETTIAVVRAPGGVPIGFAGP